MPFKNNDSGLFGDKKTMRTIPNINYAGLHNKLRNQVNAIKRTIKMAKPNLVDQDNPSNPQANVLGGRLLQGNKR